MKRIIRPARIAFYFLMLLTFFVLGLYYAGFIDAGKGQGLAGGAIVVGWGILFGGIAFVASFFIAYYLEISKVKILNWILLVILLCTWGYKHYQFRQRDAEQEKRNAPYQNKNLKPTETTEPVSINYTFPISNRS